MTSGVTRWPAITLALVLGATGCRDRGAERHRQVTPPAPPRYLQPAASILAAPPTPERTIGRGPLIHYPRPMPLLVAPGIEPPDPPVRVREVRKIPERDLAVVSGLVGDDLVAMLIALEPGRVDWIVRSVCKGPVVHATPSRVICAGARGIDALEVADGRPVWSSPLRFRAATGDRLFAVDDAGVGWLLAIPDGAIGGKVVPPEGEQLAEVRRLCVDDSGIDLYAWSAVGRLRRLRVGDAAVRLLWSRGLGGPPSKVDLCDPVLVVEVPIPGSRLRTLRAIAATTGADLGDPIQILGWWPARDATGIETTGADGVTLRGRDLSPVRVVTADRIGSRMVAEVAGDRLVRAVGGTLVRLASDGSVTWLAAPAVVDDAVITGDRLLAGAWLVPPITRAEYPALFGLPPRPPADAPRAVPLAPPPPVAIGDDVAIQPVGEPRRWREETAVRFAGVGTHGVSHVVLADGDLYMATLERRPGSGYGAGLARLDLASRALGWHHDRMCAANATVVGVAVADPVVVCGAVENEPRPGHLVAVDRATGAVRWRMKLPTVDAVIAAGDTVIASYGSRAAVLDAADGTVRYELESDNRHRPRVAVMTTAVATGAQRTLVVAVEADGVIVAREPARGGAVVWAVGTRGYVLSLTPAGQRVAVGFTSGELHLLDLVDGADVVVGGWSPQWQNPGGAELSFSAIGAPPEASALSAFGADGAEQFRTGYAIAAPLQLATLRGVGAPIVAATYREMPRVLVIDPRDGRLISASELPPRHVRDGLFSAVVGGRPVAGVVLEKPAGVALF